MRVFIFGFLVFLAFALPCRWFYVCKIKLRCGEQPVVAANRPMTLSFKDGDKTILQGYEQFGFLPNSFSPDLSANNQLFLEKIAAYLRQNPDRKITLTGRHLASEKTAKSGIFENPGIARASAIELLLEKMGIDQKRISIDHALADGASLEEPVSFSLLSKTPDQYEKLEYRFEDNTFSDANFAFGSAEFKPGDQCILYADSVKVFLAANPGKMLTITGHTDSIDTEKFNLALGLRRAESAAQYYRELGVKSPIKTASMGESQPVAPNSKPDGSDNPEGRQKNRRVNFRITDK